MYEGLIRFYILLSLRNMSIFAFTRAWTSSNKYLSTIVKKYFSKGRLSSAGFPFVENFYGTRKDLIRFFQSLILKVLQYCPRVTSSCFSFVYIKWFEVSIFIKRKFYYDFCILIIVSSM